MFILVNGIIGAAKGTTEAGQTVVFAFAGFFAGALVGLLCGTAAALVATLLTSALRPTRISIETTSILAGAISGAVAIAESYYVIAPVLSSFDPGLFAIVLGPLALLGFALAARSPAKA
ncbi:hypothetical protein BH09ACT1_BH09ACT1_04440 [soil metagenome]